MTREEFENGLDRYIVPGQRWGHADKKSTCWGKNEGQECCLEMEEVRQFLWELHVEGLDAISKLPPLPKEEPHEWEQKTPASEEFTEAADARLGASASLLAADHIADYDNGRDGE